MTGAFLRLLSAGAPRAEFDEVLAQARRSGVDAATLGEVLEQHAVAVRLRDLISRQRAREAELSALNETAGDLIAIRDVDAILAAIVRRARTLLHADMTYLSLNDEEEGASYMKVTDGALTEEFRRLRLPLGTGLLGLVAQRGAPYFTEDYQHDERFVHRRYIDDAVAGERIRAILGVPLSVDGRVIGALLAVHRRVREFPPEEVALLTSFAAHASVALENARLFERLDEAHRAMQVHTAEVEQAASAHDRLTDLLLTGAGVVEVAATLGELLGGRVSVLDPDGEVLAGDAVEGFDLAVAVADSARSGRSVAAGDGLLVAAVASGAPVAVVVLRGHAVPLADAAQRTLERGAVVTALLLVLARSLADARERLGGELLVDLIEGRGLSPEERRERARRQHLDLDAPLALLVALPTGDRAPLYRAAVRLAEREGGLAAQHAGAVVLLVSGPGEAVDVGRVLGALDGDATIGYVAVEGDAVASGYTRARACAEALVLLGRAGTASDPAGLGAARLLLGDSGPEQVEEFVEEMVGPLRRYDADRGTALVQTVESWLRHDRHPSAAARDLHVHANTVHQRLDRVDDLLGAGWRDPQRSLDLQMALRVLRLRQGNVVRSHGNSANM